MPATSPGIPLFVDLDGTLIRTDVAQEQVVRAFSNISQLGANLRAALSGPAGFKHFLALGQDFDAATLPYNATVLAYLAQQKASGRHITLATAADRIVAQKVAQHLGLFDAVLASSPAQNLKGTAKRDAIAQAANGPFEYLGDHAADLPIWQSAAVAGFVNTPERLQKQVPASVSRSLDVADTSPAWRALLGAMRPRQWSKNLLVFVPLFFSHSYTNPLALQHALVAFLLFGLLASSVYIVNDMLDVEADRLHPTKRHRPFAAGRLSPRYGVLAATSLAALAIGGSLALLPAAVTLTLLVYLLVTTLYSTWLKHYSTIDVITLTCLFTLRIIAGGLAIDAPASPWLLNFSLFFFLSLALMKRYVELARIQAAGGQGARGYRTSDLPAILPMGISSGALAVLTLTLYLNTPTVAETYATPHLLWLLAPLMLFWIYRAWIWALRDKIDEDPVAFALRDNISRATVLLTCACVIVAKYIPLADWLP